jgi:hypothetical protein
LGPSVNAEVEEDVDFFIAGPDLPAESDFAVPDAAAAAVVDDVEEDEDRLSFGFAEDDWVLIFSVSSSVSVSSIGSALAEDFRAAVNGVEDFPLLLVDVVGLSFLVDDFFFDPEGLEEDGEYFC